MKLFVVRRGEALWADGDESLAVLEKLPRDKLLKAEVTQSRNINHHRLFWALCARIGSGIGKDAEWVERAFKIETGHMDTMMYEGKVHVVLRSIAFSQMDQIQFREFFESCVDIAYRVWKIDPAAVADLLLPGVEA
jgi:hypothetical protein